MEKNYLIAIADKLPQFFIIVGPNKGNMPQVETFLEIVNQAPAGKNLPEFHFKVSFKIKAEPSQMLKAKLFKDILMQEIIKRCPTSTFFFDYYDDKKLFSYVETGLPAPNKFVLVPAFSANA